MSEQDVPLVRSALDEIGALPAKVSRKIQPRRRVDPTSGDGLEDLFRKDEDNVEGDGLFVIENGILVKHPERATEIQIRMAQMMARWVGTGNCRSVTQTQLSDLLEQIREAADPAGMARAQIPMTCAGPICPLVQDEDRAADENKPRNLSKCRCPLYKCGMEPLGQLCPLERIQDASLRQTILDELDVNTDELIHAHIVGELISWMLLRSRILVELGQNPFIAIDVDASAYSDGEGNITVLQKKDLSPLIYGLETCQKNIDSLRRQLNATPEAKEKIRARRETSGDIQPLASKTLQRTRAMKGATVTITELTEEES